MGQDEKTDKDEKTLWNKKYAEGSHVSVAPDPFLLNAYAEFLAETTPGYALDVAGGVGRHSLWLTERGWKVKLVDVSEVGLTLARKNFQLAHNLTRGTQQPVSPARARIARAGVEIPSTTSARLETQVMDLAQVHDLGQQQYDLILVFFYLQRSLFPALISALRPGGFLIYKTYTTESKRLGRGPSHPLYLLEPNELLHAFQALRVLHYHETLKEKGVAELVAQKPSA
ncbi:MAG TPA: class I SAM-dependent methyltransferase [Candidatus Solibacter sp.]|nr:class I SAM-dependent methyltransferase [Candidatus Solibacter sp.]